MDTNESRGSRLMKKLGGLKGEDMGAGAGAGVGAGGSMGGGMSIGGDAGLSQLGGIPSGAMGMVRGGIGGGRGRTTQPQRRQDFTCECGAILAPSMMYCPECGAPVNTLPSQGKYTESFEERFNNYLEQQKTGHIPQRSQLQVQQQSQHDMTESLSTSRRFDEMLAHVMRVEEKLESLYALVESLQ